MKTKEEIQNEANNKADVSRVVLEVLLDIRELLGGSKKKNEKNN